MPQPLVVSDWPMVLVEPDDPLAPSVEHPSGQCQSQEFAFGPRRINGDPVHIAQMESIEVEIVADRSGHDRFLGYSFRRWRSYAIGMRAGCDSSSRRLAPSRPLIKRSFQANHATRSDWA